MLGIGALIGYETAKATRKYDVWEVLKNGTIWGIILGAIVVISYYMGLGAWIDKVFQQKILEGTSMAVLFFGPMVYGIIETLFGSFAVPIYNWLKTIRI